MNNISVRIQVVPFTHYYVGILWVNSYKEAERSGLNSDYMYHHLKNCAQRMCYVINRGT